MGKVIVWFGNELSISKTPKKIIQMCEEGEINFEIADVIKITDMKGKRLAVKRY